MDIDQYMQQAQTLLLTAFPGRLVCLGLQGSFARGEATERSDIDLVVILDRVELADILTYRRVLDGRLQRASGKDDECRRALCHDQLHFALRCGAGKSLDRGE